MELNKKTDLNIQNQGKSEFKEVTHSTIISIVTGNTSNIYLVFNPIFDNYNTTLIIDDLSDFDGKK